MSERIKKLMLPLLYACLLYAPSVALTWLLGLDERVRLALLYVLAALLGYGLSLTGTRLRIGWHVVAAAAVAVPAIFISGPLWVRIGEGLLCAVLTLWTDRSAARRYWQTVTSRKLLVSVGLLAALQAIIYMERFFGAGRLYPLTPIITGITFFWFIAALFVMNRLSVRGAAYLDDDRRTPRSLTASNSLLVALFLALVMGVAFIRQLRDAAYRVVLWLRDMLLHFLIWLMSRQMGSGEPGGPAGGDITDMLAGLREEVRRSPFWEKVGIILLYTVLVLAGLALLGLIGWGLYRAARRLWRFIRDRLRGFIEEWQASRAGYTEEEENLFSWKQVRDDLRHSAGRLLRRFRPRVRLEDLPDDRSRVRMIFRWTLGKLRRQDKYDPARTPAEYLPQLPEGEGARFVDAYNRARFSVHTVTGEDVEAARQIYNRL
ncbi:MAG: DUF4129 domain-containing protein [Clostridiales bacterium]|nr:DUF4129 domain-containing protein [Clostridiales bacterium]